MTNANALIVGLHGRPRVGKDTLADLLVERKGFVKLSFAKRLYEQVAFVWGVTEFDLLEWKETGEQARAELAVNRCCDYGFVHWATALYKDEPGFGEKPQTTRWVLCNYSDYRKTIDGVTVYVDLIRRRIAAEPWRKYVISDVRYIAEAMMLANLSSLTKIIRVTREGIGESIEHESNKPLPAGLVDCTIANDATRDWAYKKLCNLIWGPL